MSMSRFRWRRTSSLRATQMLYRALDSALGLQALLPRCSAFCQLGICPLMASHGDYNQSPAQDQYEQSHRHTMHTYRTTLTL